MGKSAGSGGGGSSWGSSPPVQTQADRDARAQAADRVGSVRPRACVHSPMHAFACTLPHPRRYITCVHAQAAQRQQQFEQSAVGRAAYTSVKDAKKPQAPVVRGGGAGGLNAGNWN